MPDVLEDSSPGCNTDTCSNQDSDFVVEDIFSGCSVGTVDLESGHGLAILESDFVHSHGIDIVVEFGLGGSSAEGVTECAGEVSDLADVDRDVGVEGTGGDGEGMPLLSGD